MLPYRVVSPNLRRPAEPDGVKVFLYAFLAYLVLLSLATVAGSGLLKAVANVLAVGVFALVLVVWAFMQRRVEAPMTDILVALSVYYMGVLCGLIMHREHVAYGDLLKLLLGPAFLIFGAGFEAHRAKWPWREFDVQVALVLLAVIPLLVWPLQLVTGGAIFAGDSAFSIFANRNNAALYAMTLLALFNALSPRPLQRGWVYLLVSAMFGTLGVLVATVLALSLTVAKWREIFGLVALCGLMASGYLLFPDVPPFQRFAPVIESIRLLVQGRIDLQTVTFGELVVMLNTTDLSFIFRLKHWLDLLTQYLGGSPYEWLFGFGLNSSVWLSERHLVPHNDYLRHLYEFGLVTFVGFVSLILIIVLRCGRRWEAVPLLTVAIYFFSENLVTNYMAMAFFYFSAGALVARRRLASAD